MTKKPRHPARTHGLESESGRSRWHSYSLLELLAVVPHALKALWPHLLDNELHTDNDSLQWLQQQRHVSHHPAPWLNRLAEYQSRVVHIPGRTNPADFLTRPTLLKCLQFILC